MPYLDDLRPCRYTSPSGKVIDLQFKDVERSGVKKTVINEPPQQNSAEVTDLGNSGTRIPLTLYILGQEYHTLADAFYDALSEPYTRNSPGTLSHPRWGDLTVCPLSWTQVESFVDGMGQAVFTLEFIQVDIGAKFPTVGVDTAGQLQFDVETTAAAAQETYTATGSPETPAQVANVTAQGTNIFAAIGETLGAMASTAEDAGAQFQADLAASLASIDDLVSAPTELAQAVMTLARAPADVLISISDKVRAYQSLITSTVENVAASYAEAELIFLGLSAAASGAAQSTLSGILRTRGDAVETSDLLDAIISQVIAAVEATEAALIGWSPDGDTYAQVQDLLSTARARMLESSFSLKTKRTTVLTGSVDPNTAVYDLYGTWSDDLLGQFCADNDLADDEFFMLPIGRELVWYA